MTTLVIIMGTFFDVSEKLQKNVGFIHHWHKMSNCKFSPITICEGEAQRACENVAQRTIWYSLIMLLSCRWHSVIPVLPSLSFRLRSATWTKCILTKSSFWRILLMYGFLLRALFIVNKSRNKTTDVTGLLVVSPLILPSGFQCSADQSGDEYQHNKIWQVGHFTLMSRR